jgi:hypothetical protein
VHMIADIGIARLYRVAPWAVLSLTLVGFVAAISHSPTVGGVIVNH